MLLSREQFGATAAAEKNTNRNSLALKRIPKRSKHERNAMESREKLTAAHVSSYAANFLLSCSRRDVLTHF
jgi:hypothetical protein